MYMTNYHNIHHKSIFIQLNIIGFKEHFTNILKIELNNDIEIVFKILLIIMTMDFSKETFNLYRKQLTEIWYGFIELRKYSKIAIKYYKMIEKEGGREEFAKKY